MHGTALDFANRFFTTYLRDTKGLKIVDIGARDVNGSLVSTYQSPEASITWAVHKDLIWKAEYKFYGYGEGGISGAQFCSTSNPTPTSPVTVVPCNSPRAT